MKTLWIAINKKTLKPVEVKEYMEDLDNKIGHWLVQTEIELPNEANNGKKVI